MGLNGLEPSTSRLSGGRSNLLSYKPIFNSDQDFTDFMAYTSQPLVSSKLWLLVSSRHLIFCLLGMVQVRQPWLFESLLSLLQLAPLFPVGNFLFAQILSSFRVRRLAAGGDNRDRTDDPLLAKQVLSQLSYTPIASFPFFQGSFTLHNALLFTKKVSSLRKHHNLLAS